MENIRNTDRTFIATSRVEEPKIFQFICSKCNTPINIETSSAYYEKVIKAKPVICTHCGNIALPTEKLVEPETEIKTYRFICTSCKKDFFTQATAETLKWIREKTVYCPFCFGIAEQVPIKMST